MDDVTSETLAELEKTQKDFWNVPRKTGVLLNMFIKTWNGCWNLVVIMIKYLDYPV